MPAILFDMLLAYKNFFQKKSEEIHLLLLLTFFNVNNLEDFIIEVKSKFNASS